MRKLVLFMHQSLDGFCATREGGLDWIPYNQHLQAYADRIVDTVGSPVYGRATYELMRGYWSTVQNDPQASEHDRAHAEWIENVEKIVFSTTPLSDLWNNTRVISTNVEDEVTHLKEGEGKDLVIFGSPTLARSLMKIGLIDEFRFTISPVILGSGLTFVRDIESRTTLELVSSEQIEGGILGVHYRLLN